VYIAQQERDLPHLPTNLVVHEQDSILTRVNYRLSQCAFDFVAKYQLPIPSSAHPNIVAMLKIVDDPECTYVVLEYCPEGDLSSNITERGRYVSNDDLVRRAFLQILDAVSHCHRLGIFHRDLKLENILVSNSGADVLLADFALATTDPESEDHGCGSTFHISPGRSFPFSPIPPLAH
jgi:serine/threonine protein kinase